MISVKNHFDRPYFKGDIQITKYCSGGGVGCLKIEEETNASLFQVMFNYLIFNNYVVKLSPMILFTSLPIPSI